MPEREAPTSDRWRKVEHLPQWTWCAFCGCIVAHEGRDTHEDRCHE